MATAAVCPECGHQQPPALVCAACGVVQEPPPSLDLFAAVGLPRRLQVDAAELERRFYELSRQVHPDRFGTAPAPAQAASLAATALLNRAYKVLRDPVQRGRYWLELHGEALADESRSVPREIAATVFEVQERLAELREAGAEQHELLRPALQDDLRRLDERRAACSQRLDELFQTAAPPPDRLKALLAEIAYLTTLARNVQAGLDVERHES